MLAPSSSSSLQRQHGFCGLVLAQLWDQWSDVPKRFRPFFFTCLKACSLICVKEILVFDPMLGTHKKKAVNRDLFAISCKFLCKSMA